MTKIKIVSAQRVVPPKPKNTGGRTMFCGVPMVGLLRTEKGWQVQERSTDDGTDWKDVPGGLFKTRAEAEEEAPFLCDF